MNGIRLLVGLVVEPATHRGVLSLLGLEFIKPGKVASELGATFRRLQGYREAADHARGFVVPPGEAARELEAARGYLATVDAYLVATGF